MMVLSDRDAPEVMARLRQLRPADGGWTALCPAHQSDDLELPALTLRPYRNGSLAWIPVCVAGCTPEEIGDAFGVPLVEISTPPASVESLLEKSAVLLDSGDRTRIDRDLEPLWAAVAREPELARREWSRRLAARLKVPARLVERLVRQAGAPAAAPAVPPGSAPVVPAQRAPGPKRPPLESDSHVALARALLAEIRRGETPVVCDQGALWRYDADTGLWSSLDEDDLVRRAATFDGASYVYGYNDRGDPILRSLRLKDRDVRGMLHLTRGLAGGEGFFASVAPGLAFRNGFLVLTIADGPVLRPHHPENRARLALPVDYDAAATCPRWEQFLADVFRPDADGPAKATLLEDFAGACLAGIAPRYEKALILVGSGANGKSVFLDVLTGLFPEGARTAMPPQDLSSEYAIADLVGKRLNVCNEVPDADVAQSEKFKAIISGQPVTGRQPRERKVTFRPAAGHVFACNELPGTRDASPGYWRRWIPVPFNRVVPPEERDPALAATMLAGELPGILARVIAGAWRVLCRNGYEEPADVRKCLAEWRLGADQVALFLEAKCNAIGEGEDVRHAGTTAESLFAAFCEWCQETRHPGLTSTKFGRRLRLLGVPKGMGNDGCHRYGVMLRSPWQARSRDPPGRLMQ